MINIKGTVDNLDGLKSIIDNLEKFCSIDNNELHTFIQKKCLETTKRVARSRLKASGTTNQDYYDDYINNIRIIDSNEKGFTIISDLVVYKPPSHHNHGYNFSVSLAFEYGTGIVGMGSTDAPPEYKYYVHNCYVIIDDWPVLGWWIPVEKAGKSHTFGVSKSGNAVVTQGYEAVEVFRFSAYEINMNLANWVNEFYKKKGVSIL